MEDHSKQARGKRASENKMKTDSPKESTLDRRVRKTRRILRQCLTALLKEKKIQDITVRELSEMADINRGTFYLHYKDVYDLLEQIENELVEELQGILTRYNGQDFITTPTMIFSELYPLVKENSDIISILMGENGDLYFLNRLKALIQERCLQYWNSLHVCEDNVSLGVYSSFIVSGCIGIVQYWLNTGLVESPEHMASLTGDFIVKGIQVLET